MAEDERRKREETGGSVSSGSESGVVPADDEVVPLRLTALRNPSNLVKRGVEQLVGVGIFLDRGHSATETSDSHPPRQTLGIVVAVPLQEGQACAKKLHPLRLSSPELVPS
jgi:hypothetical protein